MSKSTVKMLLSEYQKIDKRAYQTLLEHVKKGNINGQKIDGKWWVWVEDASTENNGDSTEPKKEHDNTGVIELFKREQDLQGHLQKQFENLQSQQIKQFEEYSNRQMIQFDKYAIEKAESAKKIEELTSKQAKQFRKTWLGVSIIVALGAIGMIAAFMLILDRNSDKMASEQEKTIKAITEEKDKSIQTLKQDQEKAIKALKEEQKNTIQTFVEINKSNLESITSQHKAEIERLEQLRKIETKKLEDELRKVEKRHEDEFLEFQKSIELKASGNVNADKA